MIIPSVRTRTEPNFFEIEREIVLCVEWLKMLLKLKIKGAYEYTYKHIYLRLPEKFVKLNISVVFWNENENEIVLCVCVCVISCIIICVVLLLLLFSFNVVCLVLLHSLLKSWTESCNGFCNYNIYHHNLNVCGCSTLLLLL